MRYKLRPSHSFRGILSIYITIGIIGSSFVGLIGFVIDYRLERKNLMKSIENKFKNIYYPIITRMANGDLSLMDWSTCHLIYDDAMYYTEEYKPFLKRPAEDNQNFAHILHLLSKLSIIFMANEGLLNNQEIIRHRISDHQSSIALREQLTTLKNDPAFIRKKISAQDLIKDLQALESSLNERMAENFKYVLTGNIYKEIKHCQLLVLNIRFDLQLLHDARVSELIQKGIDPDKLEIIAYFTPKEQALLTKIPE